MQALDDLTAVHGSVVREQYIQGSAFPWEWSMSYAGGISFFAPGQVTLTLLIWQA